MRSESVDDERDAPRPSPLSRWRAAQAEARALRPWMWPAVRSKMMRTTNIAYLLIIAAIIWPLALGSSAWPILLPELVAVIYYYRRMVQVSAGKLRRDADE